MDSCLQIKECAFPHPPPKRIDKQLLCTSLQSGDMGVGHFQVDVIIYDPMLLAPVIYNMCTGVNASHVFLSNNLYRIRRASVHHTFRIRLIIRLQCALHHKNDVNLKFCRDSTHSRVAHSGRLCTLDDTDISYHLH